MYWWRMPLLAGIAKLREIGSNESEYNIVHVVYRYKMSLAYLPYFPSTLGYHIV